MYKLTLQTIVERAESFFEEREWEEYLFDSGQKEDCNVAQIYEKYRELFCKETIEFTRDLYQRAEGEGKRQVRYLLEFQILGYKDQQVSKLADRVATILANEKITLPDGEILSFNNSEVRLINESNRDTRNAIVEEQKKVDNKIIPVLEAIHKTEFEILKELGENDFVELIQNIRGIDLHKLRDLSIDFVGKTENIYRQSLERVLKEKIGIGIKDAKRHDIAYLDRMTEYDHLFPEDRLMDVIETTVLNMGLDMTAEGHIKKFDTDAREKKSTRAFVSPVRIPDEIYVMICPLGGQKSYGAILHELAHALHFGHMDKDIPFVYKRLGDTSVTEGFASLFDHFLYEPKWLTTTLGTQDIEEFLYDKTFQYLDYLRWIISEFLYELELRKSKELDGKRKLYKEISEDICKVEFSEDDYLSIDSDFHITHYIRGELFAWSLSHHLEEKYGEFWFKNPKSGLFLKELWRDGEKDTADEIVRRIGYEEFDVQSIIERIENYLNK